MKKVILLALLLLCAGCTTINVTTDGDVKVDARKTVTVSDPTVGVPAI